RANFDVRGTSRAKTERVRNVRDCSHQEPAAAIETHDAQRARALRGGLGPLGIRHRAIELAVFDDFNRPDRVAAGDRGLELELDRLARAEVEDGTRQAAIGSDAQ